MSFVSNFASQKQTIEHKLISIFCKKNFLFFYIYIYIYTEIYIYPKE